MTADPNDTVEYSIAYGQSGATHPAEDPSILIFDEATSALDSANERAIQTELQSVAQNKTTLVIAHCLSTVVEAHEILVMDAGRILERGTHAELLAANGRYAEMWALQQSAAE